MEQEYVRADDFFRDSRPVTIGEDVRADLEKERRKQIIDPYISRLNQDWSFLNSQVVSAEVQR
tara:strand:- start:396 stop:584 length:189 start_codon:yes stop_codon:yes gene_type:complete